MRRGIALAAAWIAVLLSLSTQVRAGERPHWIWGSEERTPGQRFVFERTVTLDGPAESATLHLAVDFATCDVSINGEIAAELDEYAPWMTIDLVDRLRQGKNRLAFACESGDGPAALALSLHATTATGQAIAIVSDESWNAVSLGEVPPELW